jgi:hypothetical protein
VKTHRQIAVPVVDHLPDSLEPLDLASQQIAGDVSGSRDAVSLACDYPRGSSDREQLLAWPWSYKNKE